MATSIINEAIRGISGHFLQKAFTHKKAHKMQTSDFHSDILYAQKALKSKQATFTHK